MIKKTQYTPKDIDGQTFCVPLYQRLFAWTSKEVNNLLYNLKEHFESEGFIKEQNPYYLGMLTTIERNGYIDLIDGQQRITVIVLISIFFKDISEWKKFLNNGKRLKLYARTEDELFLEKLANNDNCIKHLIDEDKTYQYINVPMKNALLCIKNFVEKNFEEKDARRKYAINIFNYLTFFISELPPDYLKETTSLNKYFEVLNSTGKGLEQHEILKVNLLKNQFKSDKFIKIWNLVSQMEIPIIRRQDNMKKEDYADYFRRAIGYCKNRDFDNALQYTLSTIDDTLDNANSIGLLPVEKYVKNSKKDLNDRQDSIISFPEFLLLTLDITNNCEGRDSFYQKDKLIERFEQNTNLDVQEFFHNLLFFRLLLDYYVVRKDINNGQSRFIINFREPGFNNIESVDCLRQYLSMLYVSTEFYIWLKPYLKLLLQNDFQYASDILLKLKAEDNKRRKTGGYPQKLRDDKYPHIDRYWFWRLDYYLWERRKEFFNDEDEKTVKEYIFRTNRSIEHLHPQNESDNDSWDNKFTNGFGNLAMISQSFNSIQSNNNINLKFARIKQQLEVKAIQSLKLLKMYRLAENDHSKWTEKLAEENLIEMCNLIEESFDNM